MNYLINVVEGMLYVTTILNRIFSGLVLLDYVNHGPADRVVVTDPDKLG